MVLEVISVLLQAAEALAIFAVARAIRSAWSQDYQGGSDPDPVSVDDIME
jgi:hypothetical protein|tara:strand:+ start:262 stop:411 length:150 start_codon:yes stop_codon:yes gene_type:complete